jgi:hypothetical protein
MLEIEDAKEIPSARRSVAKYDEEKRQISESLKSGTPKVIKNVSKTDNEYRNLQQRIRTVAASLGIKVTVIYQGHSSSDDKIGDVYFAPIKEDSIED